MSDADVIALVKFLILLQAENLAIRELLPVGDAGLDARIAEQVRLISDLPEIASVLQGNARGSLASLLGKISAFPQA